MRSNTACLLYTSYPDLQIHRIMSDALSGRMDQRRQEHYEDCLPAVCVQCSNKERQADDAEREVEKMKKCQYMAHRIGEVYDGVISGVTGWGMYVELPNTVEGMICLLYTSCLSRQKGRIDQCIKEHEGCCTGGSS